MLTKKDVEDIARIIKEANKGYMWWTQKESILDDMQKQFADFCAKRNSSFDRKQFLEACVYKWQ